MPEAIELTATERAQDSKLTSKEKRSFAELSIQHLSASWSVRTLEYAIYLALIEAFPRSLLPAAIYGFATSATGVLLSNWMGSLVDKHHQLRLVQASIVGQKLTAIGLALLVIGLLQVKDARSRDGLLAAIATCGSLNKLVTILNTVAVEREWAVTVASGLQLTTLNTWLRRCDLSTKLAAPLFASLLLSVTSYTIAFAILAGVDLILLVFELFCEFTLIFKSHQLNF